MRPARMLSTALPPPRPKAAACDRAIAYNVATRRTVMRLLGGAAFLCAPGGASAQTAAPTSSQPTITSQPPVAESQSQPAVTPEIVVTGARAAVETTIDRKSYSISRDLQAATGSAVDVLRNIPSVSVDLDGNPSLRGDPNVQILVDGRPSPQFNAGNRGAALEALGANGIDRIEVLTNPPASFRPDGSAGVINIVTKRRRGSRTASAQLSAGSGGRFNLGGSGSLQMGRLGVRGSLALRHDIRERSFADERASYDAATGDVPTSTLLTGTIGNDRLSKIATLGADLDLGKSDRVSVEGTYNARSDPSSFLQRSVRRDAGSATVSLRDRDRPGREQVNSNSATLRYHHAVDADGNGLTLLAQRSRTWDSELFRIVDTYSTLAATPTSQDQSLYLDQITRELSLEYRTRLPADAKLVVGYDLQHDDDLFDDAQTLPAAAGQPALTDPNFTNLFRHGQTIQALYGSYERPLGAWTLLSGLRLEKTDVRTNQVTTARRGGYRYFRAYPSLHLTNRLTDRQTLSLSYGRRVIRPSAEDLNPFLIQQDAFTLRQGNPDLRPQEIQSLELGWAYGRGATSRSLSLYLRSARNAFTVTTTPVSPSVVVITEQNLGRSLSGGLEFAASGKLTTKVDYNLSGNVFYNRIDAANLGLPGTRSTIGYEVKGALNWRATAVDTLQFNLAAAGRRLTPQGFRRGSIVADLGFRHQLRSNIALTATLSDVFASRRDRTIVDTRTLQETNSRRQPGRIALVSVSWSLLGASGKPPGKFDYEK